MRNRSIVTRFARPLLAGALLAGLVAPAADACTSFALVADDGTLVYGRTMEWGAFDLHSRVAVVPRATKFTGETPDGKAGVQWTGKYGVVALDAVGKDFLSDGMNEKGLVVGELFFPGFAEFQSYDPKKAANALSNMQLPAWILSQFATVDEVRAALSTVTVVGVPVPELHNQPGPMHWSVMDASGKAIVIEYTREGLRVYDNPLHVLTNSPPFDWHMTNLRNFVGLSAFGQPGKTIGGVKLPPLGAGSGLIGVPGDFTPPSRFVRAVAFTQTARKTADGPETVYEVLRILDTFNVPLPAAGSPDVDPDQQKDMRSSTIWSSVADTRNLVYYYHTQNNRTVRKIELRQIDFSPSAAGWRRYPMETARVQTYEDVTPK